MPKFLVLKRYGTKEEIVRKDFTEAVEYMTSIKAVGIFQVA